jgi:hypothetical protein
MITHDKLIYITVHVFSFFQGRTTRMSTCVTAKVLVSTMKVIMLQKYFTCGPNLCTLVESNVQVELKTLMYYVLILQIKFAKSSLKMLSL